MTSNQLYLFKDKRFIPIFLVQLFGCLNDSVLKNALIILITFRLAGSLSIPAHTLVMLANIVFLAPFFIFASLAGQISDKYERATITKIIKFLEIGIVIFSIYAFKQINIPLLYVCIGMLGIHSAFFGPIKYSVLPDKLYKDELLSANGYVEAGTFSSILIGTIIGGFYNFSENFVLFCALTFAVVGFIASLFMTNSNNANDSIKINFNLIKETFAILKYSYNKKKVYLAILGISWFWFISAAIFTQIPSLTRDILGADENVANLFLSTFSIGVGISSFWCNKFFGNEITTKYVFVAALGVSIFGTDLYFASHIAQINYEPNTLKTIWEFLGRLHYIRILIDLFGLAFVGGLYVVPLYAVMQFFSSPKFRSRVIAANNLINSFFMATSTAILTIFYYLNLSIPTVILIISITNIIVAIHIFRLIPNTKVIPMKIWRGIFRTFFDLIYNVEVQGLDNYKKAGKKTVIVANHLSYIDPALIASYIPEKIHFAINMTIAKEWWVKPFLKIVKTYAIEPNNPMAIKSLIQQVKLNRKIAIFPEGRISITGSLMKIYEGPGMIADKAGATILPIRIDGTQFTRFSKMHNVLKNGFFFKRNTITITILPPVKFVPPAKLDSRERRKYVSQAIYDVMSDMMFESSNINHTLFQTLINSAKIYGMDKKIMLDIDNNSVTYRSFFIKTFIASKLLSYNSNKNETIGIMLPNMVGSAVVFYAAQALGIIPAMINFTSGARNIISACNTALVKTIYTSRKFISSAELQDVVQEIENAGINIIYLEDLKTKITLSLKLKCLFASHFPQNYYETLCTKRSPKKASVILFTSGTEGQPKAVALSHKNILANRCQINARVDFNPNDIAFNTLPMFHTFGLMGMILMSLNGIPSFYYPSPLHYRVIPEVIYDIGATIIFATDTFLNGYATYANPYDFYSLRYVFAGAEKLKPTTQELWMNKFGVRIFEGYGVTEASPVISVNTSMHNKAGTVGRMMPKIKYFLKEIEGIENGGKLYIKGPNVMLGYISPENPGEIIPTFSDKLGKGWYDTGDIVNIDNEGYVTIIGRQKRFAKIAGEMVSLVAIEEMVSEIDKEGIHCAISTEDDKKGEKIILFTTNENLSREIFTEHVKQTKRTELYIPRIIKVMDEIPVLATGKKDYLKLAIIAKNLDNGTA